MSRLSKVVRRPAGQDEQVTARDGDVSAVPRPESPTTRPKKKPRRRFSETEWFMQGVGKNADELEADLDGAEPIDDSERKKYSLRTPDEED